MLGIVLYSLGAIAGFYTVVTIGVVIVGNYRAGQGEVDLDY